jgi:transcriptional regulator with XRE-family HTH domain
MDYGTQQRVMRAVRGVSQRELSTETGIPNSYLSEMETGRMLPSPEWRAQIKQALDWPPVDVADIAFDILDGEIVTVDQVIRAAQAHWHES